MQKRRHSFLEACISTAIGFAVAYLINIFVMKAFFGVIITPTQNVMVTSIFTVASIVRGYGVRRMFNWIHTKEWL